MGVEMIQGYTGNVDGRIFWEFLGRLLLVVDNFFSQLENIRRVIGQIPQHPF